MATLFFNKFHTALYDMNKSIQQIRFLTSKNIQKLKHEEFKDIQTLLYKFKDLEFSFSNSRTLN